MSRRLASQIRPADSVRPLSARALLLVGALGLSASVTVAACITSRYPGPGNGTKDGSAGPDAATDAAAVDAAPGDGPLADGGTDGGVRDGGPRDDGPRADAGADGGMVPPDAAVDASSPSIDPFDPGSCSDSAVSSAQALALLGGGTRVKLADATLYRRSRTCSGTTPATCGPWGAPVIHQQDLLTYSGGATTDYKSFTFPTHLLVFAPAGQPKFSIRHTSDYLHDATATTRGVVFPVGADPMENTYPIIYVWDFMPKPSRYEDLQGRLGSKGQLHAAEHCARVVFTSGINVEIAALYKY